MARRNPNVDKNNVINQVLYYFNNSVIIRNTEKFYIPILITQFVKIKKTCKKTMIKAITEMLLNKVKYVL